MSPLSDIEIDDLCEELNCDSSDTAPQESCLNSDSDALVNIPWTIHKTMDEKTREEWIIETVSHNGRIDGICTMHGVGEWLTPERKAIARLLCAAPKLRAALDYLLEQTVDMDLKNGIELTEGEKEARAQALAAIAATQSDEEQEDSDEEKPTTWYRNYYECQCGTEWEDGWNCMCDDRCPNCNTSVQPHHSENIMKP